MPLSALESIDWPSFLPGAERISRMNASRRLRSLLTLRSSSSAACIDSSDARAASTSAVLRPTVSVSPTTSVWNSPASPSPASPTCASPASSAGTGTVEGGKGSASLACIHSSAAPRAIVESSSLKPKGSASPLAPIAPTAASTACTSACTDCIREPPPSTSTAANAPVSDPSSRLQSMRRRRASWARQRLASCSLLKDRFTSLSSARCSTVTLASGSWLSSLRSFSHPLSRR
mmetsp:Transcript_19559/g.43595  ORF Transcript_19559/g.43595 Transcript_19559/m.43595 type:complete len:233 (+) Transcript_19559:845-1543(+)